jgi:hypothetical protein
MIEGQRARFEEKGYGALIEKYLKEPLKYES